MIGLLFISRPADRISDYPGAADLHEMLSLTAVQRNTRLWFNESQQLAGYALVDHCHNLLFEFAQEIEFPNIEREILAWGVECAKRDLAGSDCSGTLDASCRADDAERIAWLERNGFIRQALHSVHMARSLEEPIADPRLPSGFSIRPAAGEHEVQELVDLHRAAFGSEQMTVEERLAMMQTSEYIPELDLVATAPDGRLAAYCMITISQEENKRSGRKEGCTDPVATHPDFQRKGLARSLLLTGLQRLKERGMDTARLGTSSDNSAMLKAAQAVGFSLHSTTLWYAKPIE